MGELSVYDKILLSVTSLVASGIVICLIANKIENTYAKHEGFEPSMAPSIHHSQISYTEYSEDDDISEPDDIEPYNNHLYAGSEYVEGFIEGLDQLGSIFSAIGKMFEIFGLVMSRFGLFLTALFQFSEGLLLLVINSIEILFITVIDVFTLASDSFTCFLRFMDNARPCIVFWIVDGLLHLLQSICITFPIYLVKVLTDFDFQTVLDTLYTEVLLPLDEVLFEFIQYHITRYPQWVIDNCYTCDLTPNFNQIGNDFGPKGTVGQLLWQPVSLMMDAGYIFMRIFR